MGRRDRWGQGLPQVFWLHPPPTGHTSDEVNGVQIATMLSSLLKRDQDFLRENFGKCGTRERFAGVVGFPGALKKASRVLRGTGMDRRTVRRCCREWKRTGEGYAGVAGHRNGLEKASRVLPGTGTDWRRVRGCCRKRKWTEKADLGPGRRRLTSDIQ